MATTNVPSAYALLERDGKVLFVLRANTGFMDGKYGLPAGHVEEGESFSQAAVREAKEEVGISLSADDAIPMIAMQRLSEGDVRVDVFFEFKNWTGEPINNEPDKHSEIAWFSLDNLPENIMDYHKHALEEFSRGKIYTEFNF